MFLRRKFRFLRDKVGSRRRIDSLELKSRDGSESDSAIEEKFHIVRCRDGLASRHHKNPKIDHLIGSLRVNVVLKITLTCALLSFKS